MEAGAMKWELDLWYELWDRAGSQGLDNWYELRGEGRDGQAHDLASEGESPDSLRDGSPEGA
ncbi:MAG: hypothetical protein H0V21_07905 [Rubrobacter sp.]|nr:hypothetical protein [Rubrobacter sp.]